MQFFLLTHQLTNRPYGGADVEDGEGESSNTTLVWSLQVERLQTPTDDDDVLVDTPRDEDLSAPLTSDSEVYVCENDYELVQ